MPSKPPSPSPVEAPALAAVAESSDYQRLLAFLDLATGFSLGVARCNIPSVRNNILGQLAVEAAKLGVQVVMVDVSERPGEDFVSVLRHSLPSTAPNSTNGPGRAEARPALMVTGIDDLTYKSRDGKNALDEERPPFVARLNYDRERMAQELPCPVVLWVESETLSLLLKQAPDLSQWISAHFDFGGASVEDLAFQRLLETSEVAWSQPKEQTRADLVDLEGLLKELDETQGSNDFHSLRKRLAVLNALAVRHYGVGDYAKAQTHLEQMLQLAMRLGERRAEMSALGNLGLVYQATGQAKRAIEYSEKALKITREIGDRAGEGLALGNLGIEYADLGETRRAIELYEAALAIDREGRDRRSEGQTLGNLGVAYQRLGDTRRAIECFDQQLAIARQLGDRHAEGTALGNLGIAYKESGDTRRAIEFYEQALAIAREIGDRRFEGYALGNLGIAYARLGETRRAIELFQQRLTLAREVGDRRGEARALW